jgi:hypothetical protein
MDPYRQHKTEVATRKNYETEQKISTKYLGNEEKRKYKKDGIGSRITNKRCEIYLNKCLIHLHVLKAVDGPHIDPKI